MIRINRAHDGRILEVKQPLSQFNSIDDLLHAISLATAIPSDGIICMTEDGAQLNDELLAVLSEAQADQITEFYVFNREFLYNDVDVLAQELAEEPALTAAATSIEFVQPPTPRSLQAIVSWSQSVSEYIHSHASTSQHHHSALSTIHKSTSVALLNLLTHSHNVKDGSLSAKASNDRQLERMRHLLASYQRDLEILGLVRVNASLLPPSSGASSKRTLGDFVSRVKMGAVADACNRVYEELQAQLNELATNSSQLEIDTNDLKTEVEGTSIAPSIETLEEVLQAESRADELTAFIVQTCSPDANGWPVADKLDGNTMSEVQQAVEELYLLDEVARESVRRLTADKNDMTARCLSLLGDISSLQSDYADLSAGLAAFSSELTSSRTDGFRHLARLNNMLWAYGATVIEAVRRREFTKLFLQKSQALAELMAKASSRERKRRNKYRTSVAVQLPWEVKGMDEAPPSLEISTSRANGTTPELNREDLMGLLQLIEEIEETLAKADAISGDSSGEPLARVKKDLQQLIDRLDNLDDEFAVLVERNLLGLDDQWEGGSEDGNGSGSSDGEILRKPIRRQINNGASGADDHLLAAVRKENERLQKEIRDLNEQAEKREQSDHHRYQGEVTALRAESSTSRGENRKLKEDLELLHRKYMSATSELETLRGDAELERQRRLNMQEELSLLRKEAQAARKDEETARREATEASERLVEAELHIQDVHGELEEVRTARIDASNRVENLLSEGSNVEKELSTAQEHIEDLLTQLEQARQDAREARDAHAEAEAAKERLVRYHRAEADGDRAILEENLRENTLELEQARLEVERIKDSTKAEVEAAQTLRGQLRGADEAHEELVKAMEAAKDASVEAELAMRHAERESEQLYELVTPILVSLLSLQGHVRSLPVLSSSRTASTSTPGPIEETKQIGVTEEDDIEAAEAEADREAALQSFGAAAGKADAATTLAALRALSAQDLCQEVTKKLDILVTLVRKWQKTYKRHTADSNAKLTTAIGNRIAFRNFQVGDLALFLPSRNNTLDPKPWAAFNISYPHFFLNAPAKSLLAEQLRSKEWIVARIVRIIERVTDVKEEGGNPFQLPDGTRFCLLDVDGWNPAAASQASTRPALSPTKRRSTSVGFKSPEENGMTAANGDSRIGQRAGSLPLDATKGEAATASVSEDPHRVASVVAGGTTQTVKTPDASTVDINPLISPETAFTGRRPSNAAVLNSQTGFSPTRYASAAPPAYERAPLASSPSALTRAIRGASSRSPSTSRTRDPTVTSLHNESGTGTENGGQMALAPPKRSGMLSSSHDAVSKSHVSVESTTSASTAPAFGIRGRRKGLRGNGPGNMGGLASTATSPGATASAHRAIESTLEAAGNPFSQSPGGLGTSLPSAVVGSQGGQEQLNIPVSEAVGIVPSQSNPRTSSPLVSLSHRRSPSATSTSTRLPGSFNFGSGSPKAVSSAIPVSAEASLAQARGETSGSFTDSSSGSMKRPGLATSPLAQGQAALTARSPTGLPGRSPSFLLGSFGRRPSVVRGPVSSLFGSSAKKANEPAASSTSPSSRVSGFDGGAEGELSRSFTASDLLRRLSDGKTGGGGGGGGVGK